MKKNHNFFNSLSLFFTNLIALKAFINILSALINLKELKI